MEDGRLYNIALIGAGQLGSRHLQGLAKSNYPLNIVVIDPSIENLKIAESRWREIETEVNHQISFTHEISLLDGIELFATIVATGANVRKKVIEQLLKSAGHVKFLILEKVLFQKFEDYSDVQSLLKNKSIATYVNCPRRLNESYREIKALLADQKTFFMDVSGNNWGLACNGIHFLDLYNFIKPSLGLFNIDTSNLNQGVVESKRPGYIEVMGRLGASTDSGVLTLSVIDGDFEYVSIRICTERYIITIDEFDQIVKIQDMVKRTTNEKVITLNYQSDLTNGLIESLIEEEQCGLTLFEESASIHRSFVTALLKHINLGRGEKLTACPIT